MICLFLTGAASYATISGCRGGGIGAGNSCEINSVCSWRYDLEENEQEKEGLVKAGRPVRADLMADLPFLHV